MVIYVCIWWRKKDDDFDFENNNLERLYPGRAV
jgi:hypothetical protein